MNDLLEQFLIECRELAQKATEDLLALEASPEDKDRVDEVFRGFHTLKGAAGIVEFPAMGRVLHAAEDLLAAVRAGEKAPSAEIIGDCLASLDQVVQWLDQIAAENGLPASPDAAADALLVRFVPVTVGDLAQPDLAEPDLAQPDLAEPDWLGEFLARYPDLREHARAAFRYTPDADCFFRGEDPVNLVARSPEVLALEMTPVDPWPALDEIDSFKCNLVITVLTSAAVEDVAAVLTERVDIRGVDQARIPAGGDLSLDAVAVLEEQGRLVLEEAGGFAGRLGSAARVAGNVLRMAGREADVLAVEAAQVRSQNEGDPEIFAGAVRSVLGRLERTRNESAAAVSGGEAASPGGSEGALEIAEPRAPDDEQYSEPEPPVAAPPASAEGPEPAPRQQAAVRALRVDVDRIDDLVRLAGELTVAKNAIGHATRLAQEGMATADLAHILKDRHAVLERLVSEVQRSVLGIRVLPLRHAFQRFPRLVREMARELGKSVRMATEGETTEADKAIVEALFEPLLHVVRNALDHGIETEAERRAAGKPPVAVIRMRAARDGDQVIVELTDDGRGIDVAKVRLTAARKGILSAEALADLSDAAAIDLIFAPGFSTASAVTGVSGRGVGMDAVRTAVARLGGRVTVTSASGLGTAVRFTLPFTVMMVRVMTVDVDDQSFGVPIDAIVETARIPRDRISRLGAAEALVLRDRTVPLVRLSEMLDVASRGPPERSETKAEARIVVVHFAGQTGALEVDGFGETMDVMLTPMEGLLAGMRGFAGTTLLGDGRVLIVLDPRELLR